MRVETKCKECDKIISFWTWSEDRVKLAMDKGEILDLTCKHCGTTKKYHVNSLQAEPNKYLLTIAFIVLVIGTPLIVYFVWDYLFRASWSYSIYVLIATIALPVTVYGLLLKDDRTKRNAFNWSKLNEYN